jgi:signal transduction histidine kinase
VREARRFAALGRLAPGIAHEINTPTQYIGDNLRFLLDAFRQLADLLPTDPADRDRLSAELAYLLDEIPGAIAQSLEGVVQVSRMVDMMKQFATAPIADAAPTDLNRAVESIVTLARNEWKYVAEVVCSLDPTLPLVTCMEAEVKQVVLGLVLGAARDIAASGGAGRITVATRNVGHSAELVVHDTGNRSAGEGDDPTSTTECARGLSLAREVVAEHHGTVVIRSAANEGTAIVVQLPLLRGSPARLVGEDRR